MTSQFASSITKDDLTPVAHGQTEASLLLVGLLDDRLPAPAALQPGAQEHQPRQAAWSWLEWAEEGDGPVLSSCTGWSSQERTQGADSKEWWTKISPTS